MQRSSRFPSRGRSERREGYHGLCATHTPCHLRDEEVRVVSGKMEQVARLSTFAATDHKGVVRASKTAPNHVPFPSQTRILAGQTPRG